VREQPEQDPSVAAPFTFEHGNRPDTPSLTEFEELRSEYARLEAYVEAVRPLLDAPSVDSTPLSLSELELDLMAVRRRQHEILNEQSAIEIALLRAQSASLGPQQE
jgi:hypothetical protein